MTLGRASLLQHALPGNLRQKVHFVGSEPNLASCTLGDLINWNPGRCSSEPPGDLIRFLSNPLKLATLDSLKWCVWLLSRWWRGGGALPRKVCTHHFEGISRLLSISLCPYQKVFIKLQLCYINQLVLKFFFRVEIINPSLTSGEVSK